jgi:hypothetical protein
MAVIGVDLVVVGVALLSAFLTIVWWPLVLVPWAAVFITAGLFVDWEATRGKSDPPPPR